jgi:putative RecB family exonuclease
MSEQRTPRALTAAELLRSTHISYSKLHTYKQCPMRFKLEYLSSDRRDSKPSLAMEVGILVHAIIEKYLRQIQGSTGVFHPTLDNLESIIDPVRRELRRTGQLEAKINRSRILPYLQNFTKLMPRIDGRAIRLVESVKRTRLGPWVLKSILDLVLVNAKGQQHVIDFKTGKPTYVRNAQLQSYCLPLMGDPSATAETISGSFVFLKTGTIRSLTVSRNGTQEIVDDLVQTTRAIENDKQFVAKPNRLCDWCGVRHRCPEYRGGE